MKLTKIVGGVLVLFLLGSAILNISLLQNRQKTACVNLEKVFEEFKGKKELEARFVSSQSQRKQLLDSILVDIKTLNIEFNKSPKKESLRQALFAKQKIYEKLSSELASQEEQEDLEYSQKIWKQINQYSEDFGKENGYDVIYGARADGSLMYASESIDVTGSLIQYINDKYEGL